MLVDGRTLLEDALEIPQMSETISGASLTAQSQPSECLNMIGLYDENNRRDSVFSTRYRDLQCDRELERLQEHLKEAEMQLVHMEDEVAAWKCRANSLIEEITIKNERIRQLESNERLYMQSQEEVEYKLTVMCKEIENMQCQHEIRKGKLLGNEQNEDKWKTIIGSLDEHVEEKDNDILFFKRKLRDVRDELVRTCYLLKNTEIDRNSLRLEVEQLKRNAEIEREEYIASVADWRNRLQKTTEENLSGWAANVFKNAEIAREMRKKKDQVKLLQKLLDKERKRNGLFVQMLSLNFQENMEAVMSKLASVEAKLVYLCEIRQDDSDVRRSDRRHALKKQKQALIDKLFSAAQKLPIQEGEDQKMRPSTQRQKDSRCENASQSWSTSLKEFETNCYALNNEKDNVEKDENNVRYTNFDFEKSIITESERLSSDGECEDNYGDDCKALSAGELLKRTSLYKMRRMLSDFKYKV